MIILTEYNIGEGVRAFSSQRKGGVSKGAYAGFNITHYCGDDECDVQKNRELMCCELGISDERLILPRQTHGCECCCIDETFFSMSIKERNDTLNGVDAVITNLPRVCIGVSTADCVPLLLHDTARGVIAAVHAGWRGTLARIVVKSMRTMYDVYGTRAEDIRAVIGPSISLAAYEVGDVVYDSFAKAHFPMHRIAKRYAEKWHIDLWEANRLQLVSCGVPPEEIMLSGVCTFFDHENFFSARRLGINSGRIFNGIMKK